MTVDAGEQGTQTEAGDHAATGPTPPESPASDTPAGYPEQPSVDDGQDNDADGQGEHDGRPNREARFRRERNEARQERDQLRGQLDALHRQIIGDITAAYGLPEVDLLQAAGHEPSSFIGEDGTVNNEKVIDAVRSTIARYGIRPRPRRPAPNAQQGAHGSSAGGTGLGSVINKALGRNG